jgi:hypothetical protein
MTRDEQLRLLFHASVVFAIGLVAGVPYSEAITSGGGEDAIRAWRVAHIGLTAGAVWLFALAAVGHLLAFTPGQVKAFLWSLILSAYGFAIALPLAAAAGVRGLEPTGPPLNALAFAANSVAGIGSIVATVLMFRGIARARRDARSA